jgi:hypothetical protein
VKIARNIILFILAFVAYLAPINAQRLLDPNISGGPISIVVASSGGVNTSVAVAYSIRQLKTTYDHAAITPPAAVPGFTNSTTPLLRVLRSSDNGELDIGYDGNGNLDTVLLKNFVTNNGANPSANGRITVWYDQSGNSRDVYPDDTTSRPYIVSGGVVERNAGGQVGIAGRNSGMLEHRSGPSSPFGGATGANIYGISGDRTLNVVCQPRAFTNGGAGDGAGTYLVDRFGDPATSAGSPTGIDNPLTSFKAVSGRWAFQVRLNDGSGLGSSFAGTANISTTRSDNVSIIRAGDVYTLFVNGASTGSSTLAGSNPMSPLRIGYGSNTGENVYYGELILFPSALSGSNHQVLHNSQDAYFVLGAPPFTWTGATSNACATS